MKYLSGSDLVEYISERQAKQIRALTQSRGISPKLAIINTNPDSLPIKKYLKFKKIRAEELGVKVEVHEVDQQEVPEKIKELSSDSSVHGIVLQLPLSDTTQTDELVELIPPEKDVDGMSSISIVEPATAQAVLWLLTGYGIDLKGQKITIIGQGRLVGGPLTRMLEQQNLEVIPLDVTTTSKELQKILQESDIIISATGSPGLIKADMLKNKQVIIDAGTSESDGIVKGDVDPSVYTSNLDIKITPTTGGLGPLTISCLFENLLQLIDKNS